MPHVPHSRQPREPLLNKGFSRSSTDNRRPTPRRRRRSPIDVLRRATSITASSTSPRRYYRVGEDRRRAAVDTGRRAAVRPARQPDLARRPSPAGLRARPLRDRRGRRPLRHLHRTVQRRKPAAAPARSGSAASGCDHFRTDVSHLPDLQAYLDDLLRTRERLLATIAASTTGPAPTPPPPSEEITQDPATDQPDQRRPRRTRTDEREQIDDAVAVVRRHRAVHPRHAAAVRQTHARPPPGAHRMTTTDPDHAPRTEPRAMADGRRADTARRRQRVLTALNNAIRDGDRDQRLRHRPRRRGRPQPSSTATATCSRRSTPPPPNRRPPQAPARRSPEPPCRPTCSPPTNAPPGSTPASSTSRTASPSCSASTPGASPGSAPRPTSTPSTSRSPTSNNRPSTCACNSPNATRTSPPPAPPTANS